MIDWFKSWKVRGLDSSQLAAFERYLFEDVLKLKIYNFQFLSLHAQLTGMLASAGGHLHIGGISRWLQRRYSGDAIEVIQLRDVGACPLPLTAQPTEIVFPILRGDHTSGYLVAELSDFLRKFSFKFHRDRTFYPRAQGFKVGVPEMPDERDLWRSRIIRAPFRPIAERVADNLEAFSVKPFPVMARSPVPACKTIAGVTLSDSHADVMDYSNGLIVNGLHVLGDVATGRLDADDEGDLLVVATDNYTNYAARVSGGVAGNEIFRYSRHSDAWKSTGHDLVELCEQAFEGKLFVPKRMRRMIHQ